jgi:hypothetical protein
MIDLGRGRDAVFAGTGDDEIAANDGTRDVIVCGRGHDTVTADARDSVRASCEEVRPASS